MKRFDQRTQSAAIPSEVVELPFDERQRARNRVATRSGQEVGLFIERGTSLKDGDRLQSREGEVLLVCAKKEPLSVVRPEGVLDLARVAYHLGNRHVPLQIEDGILSYQEDHVLDDMVERMGFSVTHELLPFEPEPGAYSQGGHSHGHHHHEHGHSHNHNPGERQFEHASDPPSVGFGVLRAVEAVR